MTGASTPAASAGPSRSPGARFLRPGYGMGRLTRSGQTAEGHVAAVLGSDLRSERT